MKKTLATLTVLLLAVAMLASGCFSAYTASPGAQGSTDNTPAADATNAPQASAGSGQPGFNGKVVLVMGSAMADFSKKETIAPLTYMVLFIDSSSNDRLTAVSLHADTSVAAKDASGADMGAMPLSAVYPAYGADGVKKTLEARLGVKINNTLTVNAQFALKLMVAFGPQMFDVRPEILGDPLKAAMDAVGKMFNSKTTDPPDTDGPQPLGPFQIIASALSVPTAASKGDAMQSAVQEETAYRVSRQRVMDAYVPALMALLDTSALEKVFTDNPTLYATDIAAADIPALLAALKTSCSKNPGLLQLPLGDLSAKQATVNGKDSVLLTGSQDEKAEQAELQKLLTR